jgi:predicted 3-demethylubiquinone-9 3-methyltransferase (glyoxalase superfamily)
MGIVRPHLWYHSQALEAAEFYTSLIPNSSITSVRTAPVDMPGVAKGTPFIVEFTLDGMPVVAISAGPHLTLDEAFSFVIDCENQEEVDHYWEALIADGGEPSQCGWLKDRFGLSWQVVPRVLDSLLFAEGEAGARATEAMLSMGKLDIAAIQAAHDGALQAHPA